MNDASYKPILKSKTFWTAIGVSVLSAVDGPVKELIQHQTPLAGSILSIIMIILRFLTLHGVKIK